MKLSVMISVFFLLSLPASAQRIVFNDPYPDTRALEIWQLTDDPTIKYHSMYHNMTPFSHDGRYCFYSNCKPIASGLESLRRRYSSMMSLSFFPISAYRGPCSMALTASSHSMDRRVCCI